MYQIGTYVISEARRGTPQAVSWYAQSIRFVSI